MQPPRLQVGRKIAVHQGGPFAKGTLRLIEDVVIDALSAFCGTMREHRCDGALSATRRPDDEVAGAVVETTTEQGIELLVAARRKGFLKACVMICRHESGEHV